MNEINEQAELIQDMLSILITDLESPTPFEVDTVERGVNEVKDYLDKSTLESYTYWIERNKE